MKKFDPTNLADGEMIVKEMDRLARTAEVCGRSLKEQAEKWLSHPLPPERRMAAMMIMASITERRGQTSPA